jgi:hypothetical protein
MVAYSKINYHVHLTVNSVFTFALCDTSVSLSDAYLIKFCVFVIVAISGTAETNSNFGTSHKFRIWT